MDTPAANGHFRTRHLYTVLMTLLVLLLGGLIRETVIHGKAIAGLEARVRGLESLMLGRK